MVSQDQNAMEEISHINIKPYKNGFGFNQSNAGENDGQTTKADE